MRCLSITLGLLFSFCACAISVTDSWLQPEWIEDLKNTNEDSQSRSPNLFKSHDIHSSNSKASNVILSVTREPKEDATDVYSLEASDTAEDEHIDQDDIPIIISSEPVQDEVAVILSNSSESSEKHHTNVSEVLLQTLEPPINSTEVLNRLDKMMTQIKDQERIIDELKKNNKNLRDKYDQIDRKTKVNNVIFMNIRESKHENYKSLLQKVIQILNRIMRLRVSSDKIVMASRINGRQTDLFRPVVVTFINLETKLKVLAARNRLKKSKFDIVEDYSDLVNQSRRLLLPFLYQKRRQGHKVSMVQDRLIVNGVQKSLSDLRQENIREFQEEDKHSQNNLKAEKKENGA